MKQILFIFLLLFSFIGVSQQSDFSVDENNYVPNPKETNNSWVSNPDNVLTFSDVQNLDSKIDEINNETGYEIAIVVLNSINNNVAYDFGLNLFNTWGVGNKESNNGLLILLVIDTRNLTFIAGSGTEMVLSDAMTHEIGETKMKADFRNQNYGLGLLNGLIDIESVFKGNPAPYIANTQESYTYNSQPFYKTELFKMYFIIAGFLFAIYLIILLISIFIKNHYKKYHTLKAANLKIFAFLFPLPFALIYFLNKYLMDRWRNTIRFSESTGEIMHKLNETEEDEYLTEGQVTEETVKAIDYDVWVTEAHDDILILKYQNWFTKFNKCPSCGYKTYFKEYDKTLVSASYVSSGKGQKKILLRKL